MSGRKSPSRDLSAVGLVMPRYADIPRRGRRDARSVNRSRAGESSLRTTPATRRTRGLVPRLARRALHRARPCHLPIQSIRACPMPWHGLRPATARQGRARPLPPSRAGTGQRSALPRSPAVEAKREFDRAAVWIAGLDRAFVCAEQPALEQGRHALDPGKAAAGQPLVPARHDDLASVAAAGQTGKPGPPGRACGIAST